MIKFPAQFHNFRKTATGENLITISVDEMYSKDISELVSNRIGTQYMVYLEDVNQDTNLYKDPDDIRKRFNNKLHALIAKYAEMQGKTADLCKKEFKEELIEKGLIEKSTKELDLKGMAVACSLLESKIEENGNIPY